MALSNQDRVLESSTTTGTGAYTLAGAVTGFQSFAIVGNANTCYYAAWEVDGSGNPSGGWEVGVGTYTASGTTLARTFIMASSNSNSAVSWSAGTRYIAVVPSTNAFGVTPRAMTGAAPAAFTVIGGAHTALTASTENIGINLNQSATKQFATGALTTQREVVIQAPTYSAVGATTITEAATVSITGEPTAGTNVTLTRTAALRVESGKIVTPGVLASGGIYGRFAADNGQFALIYAGLANNVVVDGDARGTAIVGNLWNLNSSEFFVNSSSAIYINFNRDVGIYRIAANVLGISAGLSGNGWIQNSAGEAALESAFTRSDATLTNTNLSLTVIAGRSYRITGYLIVSNSVAAEGAKFDFDGGTATATTFDVAFNAVGGTVVPGTIAATAIATDLNYTSITGTTRIFVQGYLEVNAGGTFILRASEDTTATGTMTLAAGSWLALADTVDK